VKNAVIFTLIVVFTLAFGGMALSGQIYTGVIIDARELKVDPSKSPKIFDTTGKEIYGTMDIDPDYVEHMGIVQYEDTIGNAIRHLTAGENPVVVRAVRRGAHPYRSDVIVSVEDGKWIKKANDTSLFLERLKVVFVI
jgi:hypothetical protein